MAVKQKNVVGPIVTSPELKLQLILRELQDIQAQNGAQSNVYSQIVANLGNVAVPSDAVKYMKFIEDIRSVQDILMKANEDNQVIFVTLKAFYDEISCSQKTPSPVMSIVLQLINPEVLPVAVKFIIKSGYPEENLERALHTLCIWLTKWTWTDNLGPLVLAFMKGLEQEQFYNILVRVTINTIEPLFKLLVLPSSRRNVFFVVNYMLTKAQFSPEAFHKVIPHAPKVINILAKDEASKVYLTQLIHLFSTLIDHFPGFDELYEPLRQILQPFYGGLNYTAKPLKCQSWSYNSSLAIPTRLPTSKVGLCNLGNTCYMNSILQALYMTRSFRNNLLLHESQCLPPLFSKLQILFALLQHSNKVSLSPNDILALVRPPGFVLGHQHDSSEFLGYLLDTLHEQEKNSGGQSSEMAGQFEGASSAELAPTVVQQSFGGKTMTVSHCEECGTKSERLDNFRELQLSFPTSSDNQNVQSLLYYFLQSEKLCGDNQYRCDVCDRLTDGERITKIVSLPTHLILTLKQFRYDPKTQTRTKLQQRINLDNRIELGGAIFDLYASVVHHGSSVDSGHYYTFAKDSTGWYKFNDSAVNKASEEHLHQLKPPETPYILFYAREDLEEPESLPCDVLSTVLKQAVLKDRSESEFRVPVNSKDLTSNRQRRNGNDDDPPPPGCGGGGFNATPGNMFVC